MLSNPTVRLVNNWLHDVGTGLWAACLVVLFVLGTKQESFAGGSTEAWAAMVDVTVLLFWMLVVALVDIAITGAIRLVYWRAATPAEELPSKRPALIGKHVVFLVVYGLGTWYAWTLVWPSL